jgi:YD repeat-containing protein
MGPGETIKSKGIMKILLGSLLLCAISQAGEAQYYYKDLVANRDNTSRWKSYRENHVRAVTLLSLEGNGKPTEGFLGEQEIRGDVAEIVTHTKSSGTADSWIITDYSSQGRITKNTDTSDTYENISAYSYDDRGRITAISDTSVETDNHLKEVEQHLWSYDPAHPDRPLSMLKIKNGNDTTIVHFVLDEKGNVTEERASRLGAALPPIYYYYDASNRLTDIVRYNARAQRLLPISIFEYGEDGKVSSALIVPEEGNSFYQKWYYVYDDKGLKIKDFCYNKEKELLGTIEYQYSYK